MKIGFNPYAAAQAQTARGPQTQTTPPAPAPDGGDDGVEITLSPAAQQILKADAEYNGNSPAHMARAALAKNEVLFAEGQNPSTMPFGQIVKTFTPGHTKDPEVVDESSTVPEDGGETAPVADAPESGDTGTTEGDDATVVAAPEADEGTGSGSGEADPTLEVAEPDITEVLDDDSAPGDGEASEAESDLAGSGDAVAAAGETGTGDGETSDTTVVDAGEPAVTVDAGDAADALIDALEETGDEVV